MKKLITIGLAILLLLSGCGQQPIIPTPTPSPISEESLTFAPNASLPSVTTASAPIPSPSPMTSSVPTPAPTATTSPPVNGVTPVPFGPVTGDGFEGNGINPAKWTEKSSNGGQTTQDGRLVLSTSAQNTNSTAQLFTKSQWVGDFDVQIDYSSGPGWTDLLASSTPASSPILAAMGIYIDESRWISVQRGAKGSDQFVTIQSSFPGKEKLPWKSIAGTTGKFRIVKKGSEATFEYGRGSVWKDLYTVSNLDIPVSIYLSVAGGQKPVPFTTYFDNFIINSSADAVVPFTDTALLPKIEPPREPAPQLPPVKIGPNGFTIDGKPLRFVGANSIYFGFYPDYGWSIEEAISSASKNGIKVLRIYLWFGDRPWRGELEDMDMVLDLAARHGVYVIPVLTDLCPFRSDLTKEEYYRVLPHGDLASQSALESLKDLTKTILNRKNTVNGKVYKDDTTILAWDVANEPVLQYFDPPTIKHWLGEITAYIKSLDQTHLLTLGTAGWRGDIFDQDKAYYEALNVPGLDFFSFHTYPPQGYYPPAPGSTDNYLGTIESRTLIMLSMGKPVVLEEFGFTSYRKLVATLGKEPSETELQQWLKVYKDQMDVAFAAGVSGAMFWGWGVAQTQSVPLWWRDEDHDTTETAFGMLFKDYLIPDRQVGAGNPAAVLDRVPPHDDFDGTVMDVRKWNIVTSGGGTVKQEGKMVLLTDSRQPTSNAMVQSVWDFIGDFDVQVDFQIGQGWSRPANGHIDGATLGVNIAGQSYHITRLRRDEGSGEDQLFAWSTTGTLQGEIAINVLAGEYRLVRAGTTLTLLYSIGGGWQELASATVPSSSAKIYLSNASINASHAFTTYFDNFRINSGVTTYI